VTDPTQSRGRPRRGRGVVPGPGGEFGAGTRLNGRVNTEFLNAAVVRELLSPAACVGHAVDIVDRILDARSKGQGP
jgi:hypothetical protein